MERVYVTELAGYEGQRILLKGWRTPCAYFETFKYGMPPHGGFAIGMKRFLMQLLRPDNLRLATLFPRDMNRLTP